MGLHPQGNILFFQIFLLSRSFLNNKKGSKNRAAENLNISVFTLLAAPQGEGKTPLLFVL
jgi:hypothetical protein